MALKSTLESTKARLNALLTYANETTGESDTSIGDAIQTLCSGYNPGGGGISLPLQLELIGTWTGYLPTLDINAEGATSDKISDNTNTQINIKDTNHYSFILITIECDGDPSSLPDNACGTFAMALCSKYPTNGNLMTFTTLNVRGAATSVQDVRAVSPMNTYGVVVTNNSSYVNVSRMTWGGSCPVILGGNYTVNAYGIAGF